MSTPLQRQPRLSALPVEQAKQAIALLEQKIYADYGYQVSMGAELEFLAKAKEEFEKTKLAEDGKDNPLGLSRKKPTAGNGAFTPQGWRPEKPASGQDVDPDTAYKDDILFPESPYVCYSYLEQAHNPPFYLYETVISHRATEKEDQGTAAHSRGLLTARAIEAVSATILGQHLSPGIPRADHFPGMHALRTNAQELRSRLEWVSLAPFAEKIPSGMHINVGIGTAQHQPSEAEMKMIAGAIKDVTLDGLYLLGTDPASMQRYQKRNPSKYVEYKERGHYIENALPSSSTNPYYATLLTLAGIYEGLGRIHGKPVPPAYGPEAPGLFNRGDKLNQVAPRAHDIFFDTRNSLTRVLNHVQSGLGSQFNNTIRDFPPGREMRRVTIPGYGEGLALGA
jgi:hypothetical protein